jgi:hypothetical protein
MLPRFSILREPRALTLFPVKGRVRVFIKVYSVRLDVYTVFIQTTHAPIYDPNPVFVMGIRKFTDFMTATSGTDSTMDHVVVPVVEGSLFVASAHYASIRKYGAIIIIL